MQIKLLVVVVVVVVVVVAPVPTAPLPQKISFPANSYSLKRRKFHFSSRAAALVSRVSGRRR